MGGVSGQSAETCHSRLWMLLHLVIAMNILDEKHGNSCVHFFIAYSLNFDNLTAKEQITEEELG